MVTSQGNVVALKFKDRLKSGKAFKIVRFVTIMSGKFKEVNVVDVVVNVEV